jgi:hypothetical protein
MVIVLSVTFLILIITSLIVKAKIKREASGGGTPTPTPTPNGVRWGWIVMAVVLGGLLTFGAMWYFGSRAVATMPPPTSSGMPVVQPPEEWVVDCSLPRGQYCYGRNSWTSDIRIVKNDDESLWFEAIYNCGTETEAARFTLSKHGDRSDGYWTQESPKDGGGVYLNKTGGQWTGRHDDVHGHHITTTLRRK